MGVRRILIACAGLEEGRDGVGDYSRRLAEALAKSGVECLVLGLNDRSVDQETTTGPPASQVRLVRLPERLSLADKSARAASVLADWNPDWVSLQFVAYGFSRRGFVLKEILWLPPLFRNRKLHVMLHELWVGIGTDGSPKNAVLGALQRRLLILLLHRLKPRVTHTAIDYYQRILQRYGVRAEVLPLYGNVPVTSEAAGAWLDQTIRAGGGPDLSHDRRNYWVFGLFGAISTKWPACGLFSRLVDCGTRAGRRVIIVSAGNPGADGALLLERWRREFPGLTFVAIGPRSPRELSQFFNSIDFGVTPHPLYATGKSGTIMAMLEHGLPVIVSWGNIAPETPGMPDPFASLIWQDDDRLAERLLKPPHRTRHPDHSEVIGRALLARLSEIEN